MRLHQHLPRQMQENHRCFEPVSHQGASVRLSAFAASFEVRPSLPLAQDASPARPGVLSGLLRLPERHCGQTCAPESGRRHGAVRRPASQAQSSCHAPIYPQPWGRSALCCGPGAERLQCCHSLLWRPRIHQHEQGAFRRAARGTALYPGQKEPSPSRNCRFSLPVEHLRRLFVRRTNHRDLAAQEYRQECPSKDIWPVLLCPKR